MIGKPTLLPARTFTQRIISSSLLMAGLAVLLVHSAESMLASEPSQSTPPLDAVTLQLKWKHQFQFAGYYAAIAQGFYREVGLEVSMVESDDHVEPVRAVLDGHAHFGIGASELVVLRTQGAPVVVLASIFQHSSLVLLAKQNGEIRHIHDLVGKRVMLEPHSNELLAYLKDEGITADQLILYPHVSNPLPLINGEVDAMSAYITDEPYLLEERGINYHIFSPRSGGIDFYGDTLFTTEQQIARHPERVRSFLKATLRGWTYAFTHVDEIVDLIIADYSKRHSREHLKYEAEKMRLLTSPDVVALGHMNPGRWKHIADTYAKLGMIPRDFSLQGFLYEERSTRGPQWADAAIGGILIILALLALIGFSQLCRRVFRREQ